MRKLILVRCWFISDVWENMEALHIRTIWNILILLAMINARDLYLQLGYLTIYRPSMFALLLVEYTAD